MAITNSHQPSHTIAVEFFDPLRGDPLYAHGMTNLQNCEKSLESYKLLSNMGI